MNKTEKRLIHIEMNFILHIKDINKEKINQWKDLSLCNYKIYNSIPEDIIEEYCKVLSHIENDMPDEPGNDEVIVTLDETREEKDTLSIVLFKNNSIIGISRIFIDNNDPTSLYQGQIGILKYYSGKGYGRYLMGLTYSHLMDNFKTLKVMTVDTHPTNKPMINLLKGVGYEYTHTEKIYA